MLTACARVHPPDAPSEDLIKYGLPNDVWFHVDKLSSAHVYLRMRRRENAGGEGLGNIGKRTLQECAQLTKANSIAGCKLSECDIKYTPWSNLRKGSDMDTGTIGTPPRSPRAFAPPDVDERRHRPYHASAAAPPQHQQASTTTGS